MNVTRVELLAATTKAIDDYVAAKAAHDAVAKKYVEQDSAKKNARALACQKDLRDALSVGLKAKKPLTVEQIKAAMGTRGSYVHDVGYEAGVHDAPRSFRLVEGGPIYQHPKGVPLEDLRALKATLEAVQEELISDGQLQRLGFKNLGWVFRAAVANAPKS